LARQTDDSGTKVLYLQMAQAWIKLADHLETRPARNAASASVTPDLPEVHGRHAPASST